MCRRSKSDLEVLPPMPPATTTRPREPRPPRSQPPSQTHAHTVSTANVDLFTDPMMGIAILFYVDKDVIEKDRFEQLITTHGGSLSQSYSAASYILVDPHKESGQNLFRQFANRKQKLVLDARWVLECIRQNQLLTYKVNWAGCKLDGTEKVPSTHPPPVDDHSTTRRAPRTVNAQPQAPPSTSHPSIPPPPGPSSYVPPSYPYPTSHPGPWHENSGIPPQATHIQHVMPQPTRPANPLWASQPPGFPPLDASTSNPPEYPDYTRYRPDQDWPSGDYYQDQFPAPYDHSDNGYLEMENPTSTAGPSNQPPPPTQPPPSSAEPGPSQPRGRKRTRSAAHSGPINPNNLVPPKGPPARSPTPPTRVLKSTYGGNLYTTDDVEYLRKYIEYCQNQGLVLSLREICERIAVKAPHHTFYSWRRYCNKHQIRLGAYQMEANDRSPTPNDMVGEDEPVLESSGAAFPPSNAGLRRNRSPTPPRALTRSTTGKGIAFTQEDVTFLVRFLEYRKSKEQEVDMVQFWKDVAERAPHHSRASWMKYWRRHKHELEPDEHGGPPAPLPEKKLRYSSKDDILLAHYFATNPTGTSDQIFQAFAKMHPHHPWKGWQEHHRIHKKTVDHYVERIQKGQPIDIE